MRTVLGIDTSLRASGFGVVQTRQGRTVAREHGCIRTPRSRPHSECLRRLQTELAEILRRHQPDAAAIEGIFYCKNARTALVLGEARGVAIAACAAADVPVFEYPPRRVKQAVVGFGGAGKEQVRKMVMSILGLAEEPQEDAGDALAIAICHLHQSTTYGALAPKEI